MKTTTIFLARHGETVWSRDDYFCGRSDVPLAPEGEAQAAALAHALRGAPLAAVYCSPLRRAVATAGLAAAAHSLAPRLAPELREMDFGAWEGRARAAIMADDGETYPRWERDPAAFAPPGGENAYQVAGRATPALWAIVEAHPGETVLIVAHRTVNRILLCHLLGLPIAVYRDRVGQDTAALNRISAGPVGHARVTLLNDTAHLRNV